MLICTIVGAYLSHLDRTEKKSARHAWSHARLLRNMAYEIDTFDPVGYQTLRKGSGAMNATINRECEVLKSAIKHWQRMYGEGSFDGSPIPYIPRLPEKNVRQGFFEQDEWTEIMTFLPHWLCNFGEFAYYTGWRKSEIAGLQWKDVVLEEIRLHDSKNGKGRVIPIAGNLRRIIQQARDTSHPGCPWVFHDPEGNRIRDFRKRWNTACKKAGVPGRLFHDFRRTAVRNMITAGIDRQVAKAITGHVTDSMFTRYQIVDSRQMSAALEKL